MPPSPEQQPGPPRPTPEDFARTDWRAVVAAEPVDDVRDLAPRFRARAQEAVAANDPGAWAVYEALADACSLMLRPGVAQEPFVPFMVTEAFRTPGLEDLTPQMVESCRTVHADASSAPLRARLADIAWVRARDHAAAAAAIQSYLDVVRSVRLPDDWHDTIPLLTRALQIAAELGPSREDLLAVRAFVQEMLDAHAPTEEGMFSADLLRLLLDFGREDAERFSATAAGIAQRALAAGKYDRARTYWELAARWEEGRPDRQAAAEGRRAMLRNVAEAYVAQAEEALARPHIGHNLASGHMQRAIEALRRAGKSAERRDQLLARLVEIQKGVPAEMLHYSHSFDGSAFAEQARLSVAGKSAPDALLAFIADPMLSHVEDLRRTAERRAQEFLFLSMMPKVLHNAEGKVVARQGSVRSSDPQEREAAIRVEMLSDAERHYATAARIVIEPMRRQIILEHAISAADILQVVQYSPLVPAGREMLFTEGLLAGFYGDTAKAAHYLIPQLEHSIRVLLQRRGVRVSTYDQYGLQKELNLNNLLRFSELTEMLGEDLVFALQCLLIEKFGADLRNKMAHGLMSFGDFFTGHATFLWYLCLRMCFVPVIMQAQEGDAAAEGDDAGSAGGPGGEPDAPPGGE